MFKDKSSEGEREVKAVKLVDGTSLKRTHTHAHTSLVCVSVCVNHVHGFTAAQGHHLQPHHRSAGDSALPHQQKVRQSQEPSVN